MSKPIETPRTAVVYDTNKRVVLWTEETAGSIGPRSSFERCTVDAMGSESWREDESGVDRNGYVITAMHAALHTMPPGLGIDAIAREAVARMHDEDVALTSDTSLRTNAELRASFAEVVADALRDAIAERGAS